ncbi:hypothetical protein [Proteiniborus sp. MB09-C3]|uniref:hypothetical protein n=1 Tax=Proteiniborus sp. MB09-C3 TaxID=3050072 RepID=UPI0025542FD4|nr:hypothetical protein [Proteiniborus sp. MB09-C3]WIV13268.1 hypothetical protein QO263_06045 [Proteiniborus sp. MB09-C3]
MKTNRKTAKILTLVMALSMLTSSIAFAGGRVTKEETVYVNLSSKGEVIDTTSSIWLHSDSILEKVEDNTTLKEVISVKGDEVPTSQQGKLIWQSDKKDIYYQGKTDKELPIKIEIKYFLDGKLVEPENIVGKSGDIRITIDIENRDKRGTIYAPYMIAAAVDLPMDKFTDVKINTGKIVSDGSNQIITFVSLPGLKESLGVEKNIVDLTNGLEIKAVVKDFEMKPIAFTATSEIPEINGLDDAKNLDELIDGIEKIKEASEKLNEATEKLYDGQVKLDGGIDELINGVNLISQSVDQLGQGFVGLGNGSVEFSSKAMEFSQGAAKAAEGIAKIPESTKALSGGMEELIQGTEGLKNGQDSLTQGLDKSLKALEQIKAGKEKEGKAVGLLLKGVEGLETIAKGIGKIPGADGLAEKMLEGLGQQKVALQELKKSSSELLTALTQVEEGLKEAEGASAQLATGIESINQGQRKIGSGLNELATGTEGLKEASSQLIEGSKGLQQGAGQLKENALKAKEGSDSFVEGSQRLAIEGQKLKEGSKQLVEGTKELNEGMNQFHNEGIAKMTDEVNNNDLDITKVLENKDQLVNLSKNNKSFTGISEDMDGNLKFIMKTEGIKGEEKKQKLEIKTDVEEQKGFISWLRRIFKK